MRTIEGDGTGEDEWSQWLLAQPVAELDVRPADLGRAVLLAPHPDDEVLGVPVWQFPIWAWHWGRPADVADHWSGAAVIQLTPGEREVKERAVRCFTSQIEKGPDGAAPVLGPAVQARFRRDTEVVLR